jgi:hypothetical protein
MAHASLRAGTQIGWFEGTRGSSPFYATREPPPATAVLYLHAAHKSKEATRRWPLFPMTLKLAAWLGFDDDATLDLSRFSSPVGIEIPTRPK